MDGSEIIIALQNAKGPDRKLDMQIAKLVGFTRTVESVKAGPSSAPTRKVTWRRPDGTASMVPAYTRLVDSALYLVDLIAPENVGGCSWEKDRCSAKINDGPYVHAVNPALALCAAALQILWARQNLDRARLKDDSPDEA